MKVDEALEKGAAIYRERDQQYGSNYKRIGKLIHSFFPQGPPDVTPEGLTKFYLFSLIVGKLGRLANSNFTHEDSIQDIAVYAAMLQEMMDEGSINRGE